MKTEFTLQEIATFYGLNYSMLYTRVQDLKLPVKFMEATNGTKRNRCFNLSEVQSIIKSPYEVSKNVLVKRETVNYLVYESKLNSK